MKTELSTTLYELNENEEHITIVRYLPAKKADSKLVQMLRLILKWFGTLSTIILGALALEPNLFRVSPQAQGWVFITFILWLFAFCAGVFNL